MSDSWEYIEKQEKRERIRRLIRLLIIVGASIYLFVVYGFPRLPQPIDPPKERHKQVADRNLQSSETKTGNEVRVQDESERLAGNAKPDVAPLFPALDPVAKKAAERSFTRLQNLIEDVDGKEGRLQKYGGQVWRELQPLVDAALQTEDLSVAHKRADKVYERLAAVKAEVDYVEFSEQSVGKDAADLITASIEFRRQYPQHPRLREVEQPIAEISREQWLRMAEDELKNASPDDAGFAEGWLPIASAWQLVGNDPEAREATRRAREALPRMILPERFIESTIDLCLHESFDTSFAEQLISEAADMCEQVANKWDRSTYYAHLSGLAAKFGFRSLAAAYLQKSISPVNLGDESGGTEKLVLTQQARAASWTEKPEPLFLICGKIESLNYPKPVVNANAYAHAASAAARHNDRENFLRGLLLAENALAPGRVDDYPNYLYAVRLAEANILQRRWQAAVIIANNIPDPSLRASLLFRVMQDAPQHVRSSHLIELFQSYAAQRYAAVACAGYAEYRVRSGESLLKVVEWAQSLPLASQRAAVYAGISRLSGTEAISLAAIGDHRLADLEQHVMPDLNRPVEVLEVAERFAEDTEEPIEKTFMWLQIARTWNLLGKSSRYQEAVAQVDDAVLKTWEVVWNNRPPVKRSYNGGYIYVSKRHIKDEQAAIEQIIACYRQLALMQADLGDASGAMESCLNLANAAGLLVNRPTYDNRDFLVIKTLLNRLQSETGVGPDAVPLLKHRDAHFTNVLLAAWSKDLPALEAALPALVEKSHRKLGSATERAQPARAYAELAILYAERGNIKGYRKARKSAQSQITQGRAPREIKLVLATADALVGEFALAESNLVQGQLAWFGDASRPRSQLAMSLAAEGQWEEALKHASRVSATAPLFRSQAWEAVAKARCSDDRATQDVLHDWSASIDSMPDYVAVLCGFAISSAQTP